SRKRPGASSWPGTNRVLPGKDFAAGSKHSAVVALSERKFARGHRTRGRAHTVQPQPIRVRGVTETRGRVRADTRQRDLVSAPRIIQTTFRRGHRVTTI